MNPSVVVALRELSVQWVNWVVDMSLHLTILVAVLTLLTYLLRGRSATFLYVLWLLVLVRLVIPPAFTFPTGWGWWVGETSSTQLAANSRMLSAEHAAETGSASAAAPDVMISWGMLLMIGWAGVVLALFAMLLSGCWRVRNWVHQARPIEDEASLRLLDRCRLRLGIDRVVRLKDSENCSTPLVVGWRRPVILLPAPVRTQFDEPELEAVLTHELNHLCRRDLLVNVLQGILTALYFFHPLMWWANHQIRRLREEACDESTVQALDGRRKAYASALLKVTETLGYTAPAMALGAMHWKSSATRRLKRMLDRGERFVTEALWWRAVVTLLLAAVLLPAGARSREGRQVLAQTNNSSLVVEEKKEAVPTVATSSRPEPDASDNVKQEFQSRRQVDALNASDTGSETEAQQIEISPANSEPNLNQPDSATWQQERIYYY